MTAPSPRYTLRDLPLPAKLVVTTFLISVGLGYFWAMAQIHFKHASPGNTMPTTADLVARFSGVPWPLEPKPEPVAKEKVAADVEIEKVPEFKKPGVRVKTIIDNRCLRCHKPGGDKADAPLVTYADVAKQATPNRSNPKGRMHKHLHGNREDWEDNMVGAFFEKSVGWDNLTAEQQKAEEPRREAERRALVAWLEAGFPKEAYENNRFPLPPTFDRAHLPASLQVETDPQAIAVSRAPAQHKPAAEKTPADRWDEAKSKQLDVEKLTQSTHAHLLSFAMLWALTGIIFAFSGYSTFLRCILSPLVLAAQVVDVACWWLARLEGVGPYFALAIIGTGLVVGVGLGAQIVLSLFSMYGKKGKAVLVVLFLAGAGLFALTYVKVIHPQIQCEKDEVAKRAE